MKQYLIFDIGGTFVKWALIKQDYKIIENSKWSFNGKEEGSKILIEKIKEKIKEIQKEKQIDGIGISVPGIVDPVSSKIVGENINIKDMNGLDFKKELQGLINGEIIVENDANAAVLGETTTDELKKCKNLLMIT
ncbi:MAG: ROK family protein, partial [Mycoplasmataceae bacterium]|nr:ROK family protein [Mycoplasmataceae bacterium]